MVRRVFYSFHYDLDNSRVQQIMNIGAIEGSKSATPQDWESVKRGGEDAIKRWINSQLDGKSCTIVLIGKETAERKFVRYEIEKSWKDGKGLFGIHIHNLKDLSGRQSVKGANPFDTFSFGSSSFASVVPVYDPNSWDAYNDIRTNLASWIEHAVQNRQKYS